MDQPKVQAVLDWPLPQTLKQLRGFLDLIDYYRRFIEGHASIVTHLTNLLKKDNLQWNLVTIVSFE